MMTRLLLALGCVSACLAVILGAFGAHGLKAKLPPEALVTFETGVRYQMYHAFALIAAAWIASRGGGTAAGVAGALFSVGTLLFSGSIYLLATRTLLGIEHWSWLGPVTPLGGLCFIVGWISLSIAALRTA